MERQDAILKLKEDLKEESLYRTVHLKFTELQKINLLVLYLKEETEGLSEEELNGFVKNEKIAELDKWCEYMIKKASEYIRVSKDTEKLPYVVRYLKEGYQILGRRDFDKFLIAIEFNYPSDMKFYEIRRSVLRDWCRYLEDLEYGRLKGLSISAPPRTGKALSLDSGILTPKGWKKMRDIKVGDYAIGADGKAAKVIGVYPQGVKEMYKVVFDDKTEVKCSGDHLWTVRTREDRKQGKKRTVKTTDMLKNYLVEGGKRKNYCIDYVEPIEFEGKLDKDDLDPYYLGALLGNGCFSERSFSTGDKEMIELLKEKMPQTDTIIYKDRYDYIIKKKEDTRNEKGYRIKAETFKKLEEYGLSEAHSWDKFIPDKYIYSSIEDRIELLRGLFDTDGYADGSGTLEYTTVSERLADNVTEVARSLGGRVVRGEKIGKYRDKNGNQIECRKTYRLYIKMPINPFHLKRKAEKYITREKHIRKYKYITSIEKIENEECQCIMVDNESHLFVTDGYNLTHNTTIGGRFFTWCMLRHPSRSCFFVSHTRSNGDKVV